MLSFSMSSREVCVALRSSAKQANSLPLIRMENETSASTDLLD